MSEWSQVAGMSFNLLLFLTHGFSSFVLTFFFLLDISSHIRAYEIAEIDFIEEIIQFLKVVLFTKLILVWYKTTSMEHPVRIKLSSHL